MSESVEDKVPAAHEAAPIVITVNFHAVTMPTSHTTGLALKQAAIAQHVNIRSDFKLYRDKGNGRREPVSDGEEIALHEGEKFEAVDGDDNS